MAKGGLSVYIRISTTITECDVQSEHCTICDETKYHQKMQAVLITSTTSESQVPPCCVAVFFVCDSCKDFLCKLK